jgi:hypothetical protein
VNSLKTDLRIKAKQTAPAQQQSNVPVGCPGMLNFPAFAYGAIALFCNRHPGCPYQASFRSAPAHAPSSKKLPGSTTNRAATALKKRKPTTRSRSDFFAIETNRAPALPDALFYLPPNSLRSSDLAIPPGSCATHRGCASISLPSPRRESSCCPAERDASEAGFQWPAVPGAPLHSG